MIGECPAFMMTSADPETQKTTLSMVGLKAVSDRANFCGSDSTMEAIDRLR